MIDTYYVESIDEYGRDREKEFPSLETAREYADSIEYTHTSIEIFDEEGYACYWKGA